MRTAKTLIRLGGCPGWSESSLGAHSFCWFCHVAASLILCSGSNSRINEEDFEISKHSSWIMMGFQTVKWETTKWAVTWQNQQSECVPSVNSDQPWHPPSLIKVFAVCMKKPGVLSYPLSAQRRLWSDWADAQADLSLHWAQSMCWFCHLVAQISKYSSWIMTGFQIVKWETTTKSKQQRKCTLRCWSVLKLQKIQTAKKMSHFMTKPTKWVCAQLRPRSAWASAQSDQSLRCSHEESLGS